MKNNVVYVYVNESDLDCSADVQVFENKDDAKAKVASMFQEYVEGNNYLSTPEAKKEATKEFKNNKGEAFHILLGNGYGEDDEKLSFRVEEQIIQ